MLNLIFAAALQACAVNANPLPAGDLLAALETASVVEQCHRADQPKLSTFERLLGQRATPNFTPAHRDPPDQLAVQ